MSRTRGPEAGLTLTELTVAMVLAALVMTSLVGFYLSAQGTWLDASTLAITQREATNVLDAIHENASRAKAANVAEVPDSLHMQLQLLYTPALGGPDSTYYYWWSATDSTLHEGANPDSADRGAMVRARTEAFVVASWSDRLEVVRLQLRGATGERVLVGTTVALRNHP